MTKRKMKPVIITTSHRGVFYGHIPATTKISAETVKMKGAKMAIYWGTTKGLFELANTGPTDKSKISLPADMEVNAITAIIDVTPEAEAAWSQH